MEASMDETGAKTAVAAAAERAWDQPSLVQQDRRRAFLLAGAGIAAAVAVPRATLAQPAAAAPAALPTTHYRSAKIEGVNLFYREAGPIDAPVVLLLHGFPTSSHMFRNLIPLLADRYHVIAPDYPGFGQSDMPDH